MQDSHAILLSLRSGAGAFLRWWRDELVGLVPEHVRLRFARVDRSIVIAVSPAGYRVCQTEGAGTGSIAAPLLSQGDAIKAVTKLAEADPTARLGIRLPPEDCFVRHADLPRAARGDAGRILDLDLERSTPFKLANVYTACAIEDGAGGQVRARQFIVKRETLDPLLDVLRRSGLSVAFVDCGEQEGQVPPLVNFLAARHVAQKGSDRERTVVRVLLGFTGLMLLAAIWLALSTYESALDGVRARIAEARAHAGTVRRALDTSNAAVTSLVDLQRMKLEQIPSIEVIEELSKLLPDSVWVLELRLEGGTLDISGLARSASTVLPLFERSALFAGATMTAPLTLDQQEDKERFGMRVGVRHSGVGRSASDAENRQ